jgi:hypothetical protein
MDFLKSTKEYSQSYSQIASYIDQLLASAKEKDSKGNWVAAWGARWLRADDLTNLSS